jgi:hypothetical protein
MPGRRSNGGVASQRQGALDLRTLNGQSSCGADNEVDAGPWEALRIGCLHGKFWVKILSIFRFLEKDPLERQLQEIVECLLLMHRNSPWRAGNARCIASLVFAKKLWRCLQQGQLANSQLVGCLMRSYELFIQIYLNLRGRG